MSNRHFSICLQHLSDRVAFDALLALRLLGWSWVCQPSDQLNLRCLVQHYHPFSPKLSKSRNLSSQTSKVRTILYSLGNQVAH